MTDPGSPTPPLTRTPAAPPPEAKRAGVSLGALIGIGAAVVVLSFVASFLGATLARSNDAEPEPTVVETAEPTPPSADEVEDILDEILPAGSAVRAGTGVPEAGKGYEGDVYIDVSNADVYVFRDGQWLLAGNIRQSAAENLTGAEGEQGAQGEQGEQGAQGEAGTPGTQVSLGVGAPSDDTCETDGDIYIDTAETAFYECSGGTWTLVDPSATTLPAEE